MTETPAGRAAPRWKEVLAVVLLAVAAHAPALHGTSFTIDDHRIVAQNVRLVIDEPRDLVRLVTTSYWAEDYEHERLWRPVVLVSYALDRALFGPDPDAYRAVNVALHAAASVLALALFARLLGSRRAALAGALLFAVHPVHAEATSVVVGRAEVLGLVLSLAGMLLHLRARDANDARGGGTLGALRGAAAPALLFALGFGAKEVALTAPFILAVIERVFAAPRGGARTSATTGSAVAPYALYLAAIAAYVVARWWVLGGLVPPPKAQSIGVLGLHVRVLVAAAVSLKGLLAILAPPPTAAVYPFEPPTWSDPAAVAGAALASALVVTAGLASWRGTSRWSRAFGVGLLGYFMSLGPSSNLIPIGVVFAERLLYTPSVWAILALTAVAARLLRHRHGAFTVVLGCALTLCALRLGANARAWSHDLRVWRATVERFPDLPLAHYGLAGALAKEGHGDAALPHLLFTLEREPPPSPRAAAGRALLGRLLHARGQSQEALAALRDSLALDPTDGDAYADLLKVELDLLAAAPDEQRAARLAELERDSTRALEVAPHDYRLLLYRGVFLSGLDGREAEAEAVYDRAVARVAAPWEALINRARLRYATGAKAGALDDYRRAARALEEIGASTPEARASLPFVMYWQVALARELGRPAEAEAARAWLARHRPELLERLGSADGDTN